jgi:hypothetical protein
MASPCAVKAASNSPRRSKRLRPRLRPTSGRSHPILRGQHLRRRRISSPRLSHHARWSKHDHLRAAGIAGAGSGGRQERHRLCRHRTRRQGVSSRIRERRPRPPKPDAKTSWTSTPYFDPGSKYIWDIVLDNAGTLYVATGDHGEIYKVSANGQHSLFFKSDEVHIRVLALDPKGNLIAGSDGSGLVYRIAPNGEAFVLYSAPKKEITALAIDREGNIYAAAAGEKRPGSAIPQMGIMLANPAQNQLAPGGNITITAAPAAPMMTQPFPAPGVGATGGSEIYRIAPDGAPSRLWSSHEDLVYALGFDQHGRLLAGTGNRGHIFAINGVDDFTDLIKASVTQITAFAAAPGGGLYASSSNLGKDFSSSAPAPNLKALTKATSSTHTSFRCGAARRFAAPAMSNSMRAAAMSTIPTATGAAGRASISPRQPALNSKFRPRASCNGSPCSTPAIQRLALTTSC